MIKLPETKQWSGDGFSSDPITLTLVERTEHVALYNRSRKGTNMGYEVFTIKLRYKGQPLPGGTVEPDDREVYPSANQFGISAWHFNALGAAKDRFKELAEKSTEVVPESVETEITPTIVGWPSEKFSCKDLSEFLKISYTDAYILVKKGLTEGTIESAGEERRAVRGKTTKIYQTKTI